MITQHFPTTGKSRLVFVKRNDRYVGEVYGGPGNYRISVVRNGIEYVFAKGKNLTELVNDMESRKTYKAGTCVEMYGHKGVVMPVKGFVFPDGDTWPTTEEVINV